MIIYKTGNILDAKVAALVNTVNTVGVMGKGIALQFKHAFPQNFTVYTDAVKRKEIRTGEVQVVPVSSLNGYYLKGFEQKAAKPFEPLEVVIERSHEVMEYIETKLTAVEKSHLDKVLKLIKGFESPYGLELLATVDFLISETGNSDPQALSKAMWHWSARKGEMFPLEHISLAAEHLHLLRN
jgi:hypothetical protein